MSFFSLIKKNKYWYLYLLMMAFLLLKMARGVFGVVSQGGLWNGIQILFMLIGISFFFSKYNNKLSPIGILLFYSIWAMFVSLLNMFIHPILSLSSWFYYIAIPCAPLVLLIFYCITQREDIYDFSLCAYYYVLLLHDKLPNKQFLWRVYRFFRHLFSFGSVANSSSSDLFEKKFYSFIGYGNRSNCQR